MTYVYVASSWRNIYQQGVCSILKAANIPHYDFKNPENGDPGFHWSEIDPTWKEWNTKAYIEALKHPHAERGFKNDFDAMQKATHTILVLPCGRSAHLELGWAVGQGRQTAILQTEDVEPELMNKMVDLITDSTMELLDWLGVKD